MLDPGLVRFLAQTFNVAILSSARPGLTFVAIQWGVGLMARQGVMTVAPSLEWLISLPAMLIALGLASLETWARHDPDAAELLRDLGVSHLLGAFGAFSSALLFASLGLPEDEASGLINTQGNSGSEMAVAISLATAADQPPMLKAGVIAGAVGIHGGMAWARAQLMELMASVDLEAYWARLETGGVLAVLVAVMLAPYLAVAFLLLASVILISVSVSVRVGQKVADARCRVPCPSCTHPVRPEARCCPSCATHLEPSRTLSSSSMQKGWAALRQRLETLRQMRAESGWWRRLRER